MEGIYKRVLKKALLILPVNSQDENDEDSRGLDSSHDI